MIKKIIILITCLLIFAGLFSACVSEVSFDAGYTLTETNDHISIKVAVTNTGSSVDYQGTIEDNFAHARLQQNGETVYTSLNPFVVTADCTPRKFTREQTAHYTYQFPSDLKPGTYDLVFYFMAKEITIHNVEI